jgi:hypothetical protein
VANSEWRVLVAKLLTTHYSLLTIQYKVGHCVSKLDAAAGAAGCGRGAP